jgi:hypothetical protein
MPLLTKDLAKDTGRPRENSRQDFTSATLALVDLAMT